MRANVSPSRPPLVSDIWLILSGLRIERYCLIRYVRNFRQCRRLEEGVAASSRMGLANECAAAKSQRRRRGIFVVAIREHFQAPSGATSSEGISRICRCYGAATNHCCFVALPVRNTPATVNLQESLRRTGCASGRTPHFKVGENSISNRLHKEHLRTAI